MRTYLIDGNNYLGDIGKDRSKEHIKRLIRDLENAPIKAKFILFFDGSTPFGSESVSSSRVRVIWQDVNFDKDADDTIVRYVLSLKGGQDYILVTRDNELRLRCAGSSLSKVIKPKDFLDILSKRASQPVFDESEEKSLSQDQKDKINSELMEYFSKK